MNFIACVADQKYKSLCEFVQDFPSTTSLACSGEECDVFKVRTSDLETFVGHKMRYFYFVEAEESRLSLKALKIRSEELGLPVNENKAGLQKVEVSSFRKIITG